MSPYSQAPWELKTCAACDFVYLENPPTYVELEEDFAWEREPRLRRKRAASAARRLAKRISQAFKHFRQKVLKRDQLTALLFQYLPRGKVLDVGCGGGGVFMRLPPERYQPFGVEISRVLSVQADTIAKARGGRVVQANAIAGLKQMEAESMDAALLSGFLEHETQPVLLLQELRRVLRPNAPVIVKVPNYGCINRTVRGAKWCGFRHPDHVNYFTPASLTENGAHGRLSRG